jgi:hypothetical protein
MPNLEEVFKINGVPDYTFVEPPRYSDLLVSIRTPGRGVVVEGPSGIGKTTAIDKAIREIFPDRSIVRVSARKMSDRDFIDYVIQCQDFGVAVLDDFHKLDMARKQRIADKMKVMADEEDRFNKLIVIGINNAGQALVSLASDLNNRIDVIRFEETPKEKIKLLISRGEEVLNIKIGTKEEIVENSLGSFYIAQMLCHQTCIHAGVLSSHKGTSALDLNSSYSSISSIVHDRLVRLFESRTILFARGNRFRDSGRAPYLRILMFLVASTEWTLSLIEVMRKHIEVKNSLAQIVDNNYISDLLNGSADLLEVIHYDEQSKMLSVEDPQYFFYLKNISWRTFSERCGFRSLNLSAKRDFALSFAGPDRDIAEGLFHALSDQDLEVFYDRNEQHRITSSVIEDYLNPIYRSEARIIIAIVGSEYPNRIFTSIEGKAFKDRIGNGEVVFVYVDDFRPSAFDPTKDIGYLTFTRTTDFKDSISSIVRVVIQKIISHEGEFG